MQLQRRGGHQGHLGDGPAWRQRGCRAGGCAGRGLCVYVCVVGVDVGKGGIAEAQVLGVNVCTGV